MVIIINLSICFIESLFHSVLHGHIHIEKTLGELVMKVNKLLTTQGVDRRSTALVHLDLVLQIPDLHMSHSEILVQTGYLVILFAARSWSALVAFEVRHLRFSLVSLFVCLPQFLFEFKDLA